MVKVLVAFEFSGRVRESFAEKGHEAWSIDLQETEIPSDNHIVGNIYSDNIQLSIRKSKFDLLIAHPPCTYTAVAGNRYYRGTPERVAGIHAFAFWDNYHHIPKRCIEHPTSVVSSVYKKPTQYIQPYEFGDYFQKKTGLWLTNLPKLQPTDIIPKKLLYGDWSKKAFKIRNYKDRKNFRSRISWKIARAMADQWGSIV